MMFVLFLPRAHVLACRLVQVHSALELGSDHLMILSWMAVTAWAPPLSQCDEHSSRPSGTTHSWY